MYFSVLLNEAIRAINHVGKVSSGIEFFGEIFVYRLVPDRASNVLSNAYLSRKNYREQRLKNSKNYF
jgi:hypothetical protein